MSEIRATTISDLVGTGPVNLTGQSAAKAWSNLNGSGTIAENDSFNIASYTDNGTGDFTHSFSNAMSAATYQCSGMTGEDPNLIGSNITVALHAKAIAAGSLRTLSRAAQTTSNTFDHDDTAVMPSIHGDLA